MKSPQQLLLDLPLRQALGRDDFLVTTSNNAAVALIDQWPNWPSYAAIIIGPAGSGKSHLVEVWRQKNHAAIVSARAMQIENVPVLLQKNVLAIEDAEQHASELAFFHALNLAQQQQAHILITANTAPENWNLKIPDLQSRLNALPRIAILPPDDALLRGVLVKHFTDQQITVDENIITFILLRMPRSLEAARSLVAQINTRALREKAEITRPFISKVMAEYLNYTLQL